MYKTSVLNTSSAIITLSQVMSESVFCAVVELDENEHEPRDTGRGLECLLHEALTLLNRESRQEELPLLMANAVESILLRAQNDLPVRTAIYAGVLLRRDRAYVCTAGDCRVHLVTPGRGILSTRDHNPIDDPGDALLEERDPIALSIYRRTYTRVLGGMTEFGRPPECVTWDACSESTVLVCSSRFHQYRQPAEYVGSFLNGKEFSLAPYDQNPSGVLIGIHRVVDLVGKESEDS